MGLIKKPRSSFGTSGRRRLPAVSERRKILLRIYEKKKRAFLKPYPPGFTIHHQRGRAGTLLIDTRFWIACTPEVHCMIHSDPKWARANRLLCEVGEWNTPPRDEATWKLQDEIAAATRNKKANK